MYVIGYQCSNKLQQRWSYSLRLLCCQKYVLYICIIKDIYLYIILIYIYIQGYLFIIVSVSTGIPYKRMRNVLTLTDRQ